MKNPIFKISIILGLLIFSLGNNVHAQNPTISPLGSGTNPVPRYPEGDIRKLYTDTIDNKLYAVGSFVSIGGKKCYGTAVWDGQTWDSLGSGIREFTFSDAIQTVLDVVRYKNEIYIAGSFYKCGGKDMVGIARWNGVEWNNVGGLLKPNNFGAWGSGNSMEVYNDTLYFVGDYDSLGTVASRGIAKWDGQTWTDLTYNFPSPCIFTYAYALKHYNGNLHLAGNMNCSPTLVEEPILKLVNDQWLTVGPGISGDAFIGSFEIYQGSLYAGGYFSAQAGNIENNIFYTNNDIYFPMNGGTLPSTVSNIMTYKNELYVVGQINIAGGLPVTRIAKWDGQQWLPVSLQLQDYSISGTALALAEYNSKLIIAGSFSSINGTTVSNIASVDFGTSSINTIPSNSVFTLYPNPSSNSFSVKVNDQVQLKKLEMFNSIGQKVYCQIDNLQQSIDVSKLSKGIYLVCIATDKGVAREKLVVE